MSNDNGDRGRRVSGGCAYFWATRGMRGDVYAFRGGEYGETGGFLAAKGMRWRLGAFRGGRREGGKGICPAEGGPHPFDSESKGFRRPAASDIPSTPRAIQWQVRPTAAFCVLGGIGKLAFQCLRTHKNAAPNGAAPASGLRSAEKKGFEPLKQVYARLAHFECAAFVHSATSPGAKIQKIPAAKKSAGIICSFFRGCVCGGLRRG